MKNLLFLLFVFPSLFRSMICLADPPPGTVKIGMVYSLTGPAETWSSFGRQGAELAAGELNAAGRVAGKKLALVFEDSKTTSAGAISAYRKLVDIEKVDALIGDVWDFVTNPLVPLTVRDKKVLISPTVVPEAIESKSDYFFTMGYQIALTKDAIGKFFELNPDVRKVAIVCWDNPWGHAFLREWKSVISERNLQIADERCQYGFDYDYRSDAAAIAAKHPDAVLMSYQEERIIKRLHELKFYPKILSSSNLAAVKLNKLLPDSELEGAFFTDWDPTEEFKETFQAKFGHAPMFEAYNHYLAIKSLARAFESEQADKLSALKALHFEGASGPVDFSHGFAVNYGKAVLKKISAGEIRSAGQG